MQKPRVKNWAGLGRVLVVLYVLGLASYFVLKHNEYKEAELIIRAYQAQHQCGSVS